MLRIGLRASLWLALLPAIMLSFVAMGAGLRIDLWRWDEPHYPLLILASTAFPLAIAYALIRTRRDHSTRRLVVHTGLIWTCIGAYVAFAFGWLPQSVYESWS